MKFTFIDGKERDIKFSFKDILAMQDEVVPEGETEQERAMRTCKMIATGLQRGEPDITPEQVADLVDMETFLQLRDALNTALGKSKIEEPRPTPEG